MDYIYKYKPKLVFLPRPYILYIKQPSSLFYQHRIPNWRTCFNEVVHYSFNSSIYFTAISQGPVAGKLRCLLNKFLKCIYDMPITLDSRWTKLKQKFHLAPISEFRYFYSWKFKIQSLTRWIAWQTSHLTCIGWWGVVILA